MFHDRNFFKFPSRFNNLHQEFDLCFSKECAVFIHDVYILENDLLNQLFIKTFSTFNSAFVAIDNFWKSLGYLEDADIENILYDG